MTKKELELKLEELELKVRELERTLRQIASFPDIYQHGEGQRLREIARRALAEVSDDEEEEP